jgi:hypothetical protein
VVKVLCLLLLLLVLVTPPRVGVVVNARVSSQLVRSGELLTAPREAAGVGLLSGVSPDVSRLVLQTVEGLIAERTFVRSRQLRAGLGRMGSWKWPIWLDDSDRSRGHLDVCVLVLVCGSRRVEQIRKIHRRLSSLHVIQICEAR